MTTEDTLKPSANEIIRQSLVTFLNEFIDEIEILPEETCSRLKTTKEDMLREAKKTLKAVEGGG